MSSSLIISLETISCFLSIIGSSCVALTWAYPVDNRRKHGRILLLWLSVSDFMSSVVYAIQSLSGSSKSAAMCKALALLGIFFPVASFLWTDFIAFYLYLVVVRRSNRLEWSTLLRMFHITAWSVSGIVLLFVAVYDRAGNASVGDDDAIYANAGGWCWISGTDETSQFIWELIGGKVIEWLSCLLVLPYFYCAVSQRLRNWDSATVLTTTTAPMRQPQSSPGSEINSKKQISSSLDTSGAASKPSGAVSSSSSTVSEDNVATGTVDRIVDSNQRTISVASNPSMDNTSVNNKSNKTGRGSSIFQSGHDPHEDDDEDSEAERSKYACEDLSEAEHRESSFIDQHESGLKLKAVNNQAASGRRSDLLPVMVKNVGTHNNQNNNAAVRGLSMVSRSAGKRRELFSQFYTKLLALPLVFLFIRTWGSLRVILAYANYRHKPTLQFFDIMQAFFDPSQGFFNAILFVFLSPEDRAHLLLSLAVIMAYIGKCFPPCSGLSQCFANSSDVSKEMKRVEKYYSHRQKGGAASSASRGVNSSAGAAGNNQLNVTLSPETKSSRSSSFGGISFEDESMFECDDANRISDFSFESRLDADNQEFP